MKGFFKSLFDLKFEHFITRKIAGVFYAISLGAIGLFSIVALGAGIFNAIKSMTSYYGSPAEGFLTLIVTLIIVPVLAFVSVILTRLLFESSVALVTVAENTKK